MGRIVRSLVVVALILGAVSTIASAGPVIPVMLGTPGNDHIAGSGEDDAMRALEGDDVLKGRHGNDTLNAGKGDDTIVPGTGDDLVSCGEGFDVVVVDGTSRDGTDRLRDCEAVVS